MRRPANRAGSCAPRCTLAGIVARNLADQRARRGTAGGTPCAGASPGVLGCGGIRICLLLVGILLLRELERIDAGVVDGPLVAFGLVLGLL